MQKGLLISFEGLDKAGKTTQIEALGSWLFWQEISYVVTREPGGTAIGRHLRALLMSPPDDLDPLAEMLLFQADSAQHFAKVVLPAIEEGKIVITDRCFDSNIVYQGYIKGVSLSAIFHISSMAMRGKVPDLTILLDLTSEEMHKRCTSTGDITRFDTESILFHKRAREAFISQAKVYPDRIKIIDASQSAKEVHKQVIKLVRDLFLSRLGPILPYVSNLDGLSAPELAQNDDE